MLFGKKDEKNEVRLALLEREINRLETMRASTEPGTDAYAVLTSQLDALYQEKEKHLTPWSQRPDGKAMIVGQVCTGIIGLGLATFEHWFPVVGKAAGHAMANVFRGNRRV